ncbi:hypothetical protein LPJ66_012332, partial [Kickxella alabastrina]
FFTAIIAALASSVVFAAPAPAPADANPIISPLAPAATPEHPASYERRGWDFYRPTINYRRGWDFHHPIT